MYIFNDEGCSPIVYKTIQKSIRERRSRKKIYLVVSLSIPSMTCEHFIRLLYPMLLDVFIEGFLLSGTGLKFCLIMSDLIEP